LDTNEAHGETPKQTNADTKETENIEGTAKQMETAVDSEQDKTEECDKSDGESGPQADDVKSDDANLHSSTMTAAGSEICKSRVFTGSLVALKDR